MDNITVNAEHVAFLASLRPNEFVTPDPFVHLTGTMTIAGTVFYVQAIQVHVMNDCQEAADPEFSELFDALHTASQADGHLQTFQAFGRQYVVHVSPYGA